MFLQKGGDICKYMNNWKQLNEMSLSHKNDFYRHLNMEDFTDAVYTHGQGVCKGFEIKNLGEYHDLYLKIHYC